MCYGNPKKAACRQRSMCGVVLRPLSTMLEGWSMPERWLPCRGACVSIVLINSMWICYLPFYQNITTCSDPLLSVSYRSSVALQAALVAMLSSPFMMSRCDLEPLAVDAGILTYASDKTVHLILTNTGQVKARWQFAFLPGSMFNEPEDQALRRCPRWAKVSPEEVTIMRFARIIVFLSSQ